jgi:ABC-type phosphate transport system permease subunit
MTTTITLPIKCSTAKTIYAMAKPLLELLPHIIVWGPIGVVYMLSAIAVFNPLLIHSEPGSLYHDAPFMCGITMFVCGVILSVVILVLLYEVSVTCIKDDEVQP